MLTLQVTQILIHCVVCLSCKSNKLACKASCLPCNSDILFSISAHLACNLVHSSQLTAVGSSTHT
ncbi:hypothetical protein HanXRQr2_Chr16g0749971 [Helianthus annuus]|uniref:Uncharacterized protein n=1 Tax=Helianthus annuus TaxID=4232 RepID=A0A251RZ81_HELAN|nr:hypothetical protein HanXRQr2_Chr16g0749971 [Helianthus annuus]